MDKIKFKPTKEEISYINDFFNQYDITINHTSAKYDILETEYKIKTFILHYRFGDFSEFLTYEEYLNPDIQKHIEAFNLDKQSFWYLILMFYDLTKLQSTKTYQLLESRKDTSMKIIELLQTKKVDIIFKSEDEEFSFHNYHQLNNQILIVLKEFARKEKNKSSFYRKIPDFNIDIQTPDSLKRYFFAQLLDNFLKNHIDYKIQRKNVEFGLYNKKILIGKILYYSGLVDNESYIDSDNALKILLKKYKDYKFKGINYLEVSKKK